MFASVLENEFAREVRSGLCRPGQKTLPCRFLYDDLGSALFEAITCLPEYGLTRADARVIQANAAELVDAMPAGLVVVELGSGSGVKTRAILERLGERQTPEYYPIDISPAALDWCAQELCGLAKVFPINAGYLEGLREAGERRPRGAAMLVLFLGSTIGNFEPEAAAEFLYSVRQCLQPGDALLLGTDLIKDVPSLLEAYDDPTGVTAAFNLNLLGRINRELGADFDLRQFEHVVRYDAKVQRIEMHLRSRTAQTVRIPEAELSVDFEPGETIFTEACHKFRREQICALARTAGFHVAAQWIDEEWPFAESLLAV
jgi:L-histidine N-alpha-methyltransferase